MLRRNVKPAGEIFEKTPGKVSHQVAIRLDREEMEFIDRELAEMQKVVIKANRSDFIRALIHREMEAKQSKPKRKKK